MHKLTSSTAKEIQALRSSGLSVRQVAKKLGLSPSTVSTYSKPKLDENTTEKKRGRPAKLTSRMIAYIIRLFEAGLLLNCTDACNQIFRLSNIKISKWSLARILKNDGIMSYSKSKKPRLLPRHRKQRLLWARKMDTLEEDVWQYVIFTDESKICAYGPDGNNRVWRRRGSPLKSHHYTSTVKFGGKSVMVWGAITYHGVGKLVFIDGKMNSEMYVEILKTGYVQTLEMHGFRLPESIFQQDNDSKHTSLFTKRYLFENNYRVLKWPSISPDMNPIENVWGYIKNKLSLIKNKPSTVTELKIKIKEIWENIPVEYIRELFDSMPRRVKALLKAKGGHTKY